MENIQIIVDNAGRYIIGDLIEDQLTDKTMVLKNPGILAINPAPNGQLQVQIIPLMFREFLAPDTGDILWSFSRKTCSTSAGLSLKLNPQIIQQYKTVITPRPQTTEQPKIVKLFEE